ncbi:MAG TPA: RDD family protein [Actinomycetota bacterium]
MANEVQTQARPHVRSVLPPAAYEVQGQRAGVVTRTIVMVVDAAVVAATIGVAYLVFAAVRFMRRPVNFSWPTVTFGTVIVASVVVCVLYLTVTWSATGRSVGKRLFGLRVVGRDGEPIHLIRAFLRAITCTFFPMLMYWAAISSQNRSIQDLALRTSVIYDWRSRGRVTLAPEAGRAGASGEDAVGAGVDVAAPVADEADDRHAEPLPRLDGE